MEVFVLFNLTSYFYPGGRAWFVTPLCDILVEILGDLCFLLKAFAAHSLLTVLFTSQSTEILQFNSELLVNMNFASVSTVEGVHFSSVKWAFCVCLTLRLTQPMMCGILPAYVSESMYMLVLGRFSRSLTSEASDVCQATFDFKNKNTGFIKMLLLLSLRSNQNTLNIYLSVICR